MRKTLHIGRASNPKKKLYYDIDLVFHINIALYVYVVFSLYNVLGWTQYLATKSHKGLLLKPDS